MTTVREEITALLDKLPPESTLEDVQYHLYVLEKVHHGLEAIKVQGGISQEEAEKRLEKWIIK